MQGKIVLVVLALIALSQSMHLHEQQDDFDIDFIKLKTVQQMVGQWAVAVGVIRSKIMSARGQPGVNFITLRVNLPDGLGFQWANMSTRQYTNQNQRILTYKISVNNIYPNASEMFMTQFYMYKGQLVQEQRLISLNETYKKLFEVSHFIGIMIAEQIRFSTLVDSVNDPKYEINKVQRDWNPLFNYFYDNFKQPVYNDWKKLGSSSVNVKLLNGNTVLVKVLVALRSGP